MDKYPTGARPVQQHVPQASAPAPAHRVNNSKGSKKTWVMAAVVVAVLVVGGVLGTWLMAGGGEGRLVKSDKYQTVFLTNGQVYFGKIAKVNNDYVQLTDIYYLQVQQSVQPTGSEDKKDEAANSDSQTQLVKLGDELHGPEDSMQINRSQVLFWENIKADGKVAKAISEYKKK